MKNRIIVGGALLSAVLFYVVFFNLNLVPWVGSCGEVVNAESTVG